MPFFFISTYLPETDAGVGVLEDGDPAIGVQRDEGLFFDLLEVEKLVLVGEAELLEDDGYLPRVGAARVGVEGHGLEAGHFQ